MKYNNQFYNNNKDLYKESVMQAFKEKLTETTNKLQKLKQQANLEEGWDDMMKASKERAKEKGTGKFDKKSTSTGTVYTRKSSTFDDGGKDADQKKAEKKGKKANEGLGDVAKKVGGALKKAGSKALDKLGHGSDEDMLKDLQRKAGAKGAQVHGKKSMAVKNEALKGGQKKLDADKDGKLEKSDFAKLRSSKGVKEASHQEKTTMKHVKNPTAGEKKAAKDIKAGVKGYADRVAMLKSAEKDGRLKEGNKPDFLDMDKDGNKKEPMKKAVADKKKNPFGKK